MSPEMIAKLIREFCRANATAEREVYIRHFARTYALTDGQVATLRELLAK